jgi:hypothetical protein
MIEQLICIVIIAFLMLLAIGVYQDIIQDAINIVDNILYVTWRNFMERTTVMLLPVCECGNVIPGLVVDTIVDVDGWKHRLPFTPEICPRCKKLIDFMSIDTRYLKAFAGNDAVT